MSQFQFNRLAEEFKQRAPDYWATAVAFAKNEGPPPAAPYQVEVHPTSIDTPNCQLRCVDCLGRFLSNVSHTPAGTFNRLLDDLAEMGVPSVVLSGIYSDPSSNKKLLTSLLLQHPKQWGVRLHTHGLGTTKSLCDAVIQAAAQGPKDWSYLTVSKVTTSPFVFSSMHRPRFISPEKALRQEETNLQGLFSALEKAEFPLDVTINCRITKLNGSVPELAEMFRWFNDTPKTVRLRLTNDYLPTNSTIQYEDWFFKNIYLSIGKVKRRIDEALNLVPVADSRLSLRTIDDACDYEGPRCYNSLLFAGVSTNGKMFPCHSVASDVYADIAYGSLITERFPNIWRRFVDQWHQHPVDVTKCPQCAAICESQINTAIHGQLQKG